MRVLYYVTVRPVEIYADKNWCLQIPEPLSAVECARRQVHALAVLKTAVEPIEREVLGLSHPSGLAVAESGDTTHVVALRDTTRVIALDASVIETALAAPSLQFARLEQSIPLESGVSIRTITVQRREGPRANDPVEDFARLWRKARNFNLRQPPTPVSVDPAKLAAALAAAHRRDMRLVQLISERVTVGGQRGHRDPRSLRVAIAATNNHHADDFGGQLAAYALPPGDPHDVDVQFVPDPTLTDGEALYEAAFGPDELRTDFWDATAQTVIASVLGFIDDEIEFVA